MWQMDIALPNTARSVLSGLFPEFFSDDILPYVIRLIPGKMFLRGKEMLSSCWHRSVHVFTWAAASFFAQSANALPLQCTLSADQAMVAAGASTTLRANCTPAAASFQWSGGSCSDPTSSTC